MLSQWLWIMVLCWTNGCESWCDMLGQWLWITVYYVEPVVVNELCYTKLVVVNHGVLCWANWLRIITCYAEPSGLESWCVLRNQWLCIIVCYAEPVFVNHNVLCCASRCESWRAMLSPVLANQVVSCRISGCESWFAMLSQWLWIMVSYAEPVLVNHGISCWAIGCELWWAILSQWLWIMVCYSEPVVVNHGG
jgi:hypothetical protein